MSINGIFGIFNEDYLLSPVILIGSIISLRFWINPCYDWIRIADIYWVRLGIIGFSLYNYYIVESILVKTVLTISYIVAGYNFFLATGLHNKHDNAWFLNHYISHWIVLFSHSVSIGEIILNKTQPINNKLIRRFITNIS